jgi:hypothetical protein
MSDDEIPPAAVAIVELLNSRPHSYQGETLEAGVLRDLRSVAAYRARLTEPG